MPRDIKSVLLLSWFVPLCVCEFLRVFTVFLYFPVWVSGVWAVPYKTTADFFSQCRTPSWAAAPLPPDVTFVWSNVALITWAGDKLGQQRSWRTTGQFEGKSLAHASFPPTHTLNSSILRFCTSQRILNTAACALQYCIKETRSTIIISPWFLSRSLFYFPAHLSLCRLILQHGAWWKQRSWSRLMR